MRENESLPETSARRQRSADMTLRTLVWIVIAVTARRRLADEVSRP